MATSIDIETQGDHQYVVRMRDDEESCETWFKAGRRRAGEALRSGGRAG